MLIKQTNAESDTWIKKRDSLKEVKLFQLRGEGRSFHEQEGMTKLWKERSSLSEPYKPSEGQVGCTSQNAP